VVGDIAGASWARLGNPGHASIASDPTSNARPRIFPFIVALSFTEYFQ